MTDGAKTVITAVNVFRFAIAETDALTAQPSAKDALNNVKTAPAKSVHIVITVKTVWVVTVGVITVTPVEIVCRPAIAEADALTVRVCARNVMKNVPTVQSRIYAVAVTLVLTA